MIISIDVKKAYDKLQHLFMIKNSEETRNREEFSQLDREHLPKQTNKQT